MNERFSLFIASLLLAPLSYAEPAPAPDPAPTKEQIPALIKQLGDDSPKVRDQASQQLRKLGADALPALAAAQKGDDAEVVSRSQTITKQIDDDLHPKPKVEPNSPNSIFLGNRGQRIALAGGGNVQIQITSTVMNGNGRSVSISKTNNGTVKETTVKEDGKTTKIHEDAEGIAVTITEMKDGKEVSETIKAKDKETLKKDNPKVFEIYEKNSKDDVRFNGQPGQLRIMGLPNAEKAQLDMEKRFEEAQKRAEDRINKLEKDAEEQIKALEKQVDEVRRQTEKPPEVQKE